MSDETPTIAPALTPEEWAELRVRFPRPAGFSDFVETGYWLDEGEVVYGLDVEGCTRDMGVDRQHALAALCLHGMPFGFTREDVAMVQEEADEFARMEEYTPGVFTREVAAWRLLVSKLRALLPPEV